MECFLALDVGTTAVKAAVIDQWGKLVGFSRQEYRLESAGPGRFELDPEVYWQCCVASAREAARKALVSPAEILSVGVCSQGETFILLDEADRAVRKAIVWLDTRATREAAELAEELGDENPTGQNEVTANWPISKIRWLATHEPTTIDRARRFLLVEDYILYRLTGEQVGEYSLYSSTYMLDIRRKQWWKRSLDAAGVSSGWLSTLVDPGTVVGPLNRRACAELGLGPACVAVTGAMDQTAAMLGAGCIQAGIVAETTGAALVVATTLPSLEASVACNLSLQCHALSESYLLTGWTPSAGMSLAWMRDVLFPDLRDEARLGGRDPYDAMTDLAARVAPGSDGLLFLPFMGGTGTLRLPQGVRGGFHGLTILHTRGHLVRSLLEGVAATLALLLSDLEESAPRCDEVRSLGGGARSDLWCQINADVTERRVRRMECSEAASLGSAMLQAVAAGRYANPAEAVAGMVRTARLFEPDPSSNSPMRDLRRRFSDAIGRAW